MNKGTLTVTRREIKLKPQDETKTYDGTALTAKTVVCVEGYSLGDGDVVTAEILGSLLEPGTTASSIKDGTVKFINKNGEDVTDCYNVLSYENGTLTVEKAKITIKPKDASKIYDGNALSAKGIEIVSGRLYLDHKFVDIEFDGEITNVGTAKSSISSYKLVDGDGNDKSNCYDVTLNDGELIVNKRPITIKTGSARKLYDGNPLSCKEYTITSGSLASGQQIVVESFTEISEVGKSENTFTIKITAADGTDVTVNYDITQIKGELEIFGGIIVKPKDATKSYDGTPLVATAVEYNNAPEGYSIIYKGKFIGEQTVVGTAVSSLEEDKIFVYDEVGNDVTSKIKLSFSVGTLTVAKREITIKSNDASKPYDGSSLVSDQWEALNLPKGRTVNVSVIGSRTEPGVGVNELSRNAVIKDKNGNDVTDQFNVSYREGKLWVYLELTVTTGSATKEYDGTPLVCGDCNYSFNGAEYEYDITIETTGSQTKVGSSKNTYSLKVTDKDGNDVKDAVKVVSEDVGTLTVTESDDGKDPDEGEDPGESGNPSENPSENPSGTGGGSSSSSGIKPGDYSDENEGSAIEIGSVYADKNGMIYLKDKHFGNFVKNEWQSAPQAYSQTLYGYSYEDIISLLLDNNNYATSGIIVKTNGSHYTPQYPVLNSLTTGENGVYKISRYLYDYLTNGKLDELEELNSFMTGYNFYVKENYLYVNETTKAGLKEIIAENNINSIEQAVAYIQKAATYNLKWNTNLENEDDVVLAFLNEYKEGVCYHFATAATLMLRTMGYPARIASGYAVDGIAYKEVPISGGDAHAWVEVYLENIGWVTLEVTGSSEKSFEDMLGELEITVIADGANKVYDGTPLVAPKTYTLDEKTTEIFKKYGVECVVTIEGSQTDVGTGYAVITTVALYKDGVEITDKVKKINRINGELTVKAKEVIVYISTKSIEYDGKEYGLSDKDYISVGLNSGDKLTIELSKLGKIKSGILSAGGIYKLTKIVDSNGNDVTSAYHVVFTSFATASSSIEFVNTNYTLRLGDDNSVLQITKRKITLTSNSADKEYDGTALKDEKYTMSFGSLANGHTISIVSWSVGITDPGSCKNTFVAVIKDADGNDVTKEYELKYNYGTLEVR